MEKNVNRVSLLALAVFTASLTQPAQAAIASDPQLAVVVLENWETISTNAVHPVAQEINAGVVVIEFGDYRCPICRTMAPRIAKILRADPSVRYVFRQFPILGNASYFAARASIAAARQPQWQSFHFNLMGVPPDQRIEDAVLDAAKRAGMDLDILKRDMVNVDISKNFERNFRLAELLGVDGTPTFLINDTIVHGQVSEEEMRTLIDSERPILNPKVAEGYITRGKALIRRARQRLPLLSPVSDQGQRAANQDFLAGESDFEQATRIEPENAVAHYQLGLARAAQKKWELAIASFEVAIHHNPHDLDWHIEREQARREIGDLDGVLKDYNDALERTPHLQGLYLRRAQALREARMPDVGIRDLDTAITLSPDEPAAYVLRGHFRYEGGKIDDATEDYRRSIELNPNSGEGYAGLGHISFDSGDYEGAAIYFKEALRHQPWDISSKMLLGYSYYNNENFSEAIEELTEITEWYPDSFEVHYWLGRAYFDDEDYGNAIKILEASLLMDSRKENVAYWLGKAHYVLGQYGDAAQYFQEAVSFAPNDSDVSFELGVASYLNGEFDAAIAALDKAIEISPDDPVLYYWRGISHDEAGDRGGARRDLRKAVGMDSVFAEAYNALAWLLCTGPSEERNGEEAVVFARMAVNLVDDSSFRDTLAAALVEVGRADEAIEEYERALSMDPDLLHEYQVFLQEEGYLSDYDARAYDSRTNDALLRCVRSGCQLLV